MFPSAPGSASASTGSWVETTCYPTAPEGLSCVTSSQYMYCVGGRDWVWPNYDHIDVVNNTYYAQLSPSGIGQWIPSTPYPMATMDESCVTKASFIYCVGGNSGNADNGTANAYFAPLSSSGIGNWTSTTSYPDVGDPQCALDLSYIFCVGSSGQFEGETYFAPLTDHGIGSWGESVPLPPVYTGCALSNTAAYCFNESPCPSGACENNTVDYAPLLASGGTGPWNSTSPILFPLGDNGSSLAFVIVGSNLYFKGWTPYVLSIDQNGVESVNVTSDYPYDFSQGCVASSGFIYCIGGFEVTQGFNPDVWTNEVFYTSIQELT